MFEWSFIASTVATVAFDLVYFGLVIGTIVVIVLDSRNPVKTLAWVLVLMFLPLIGLLLYFFFGRTHRREQIITRKSYNRLLKNPMAEYLTQQSIEVPPAYQRLMDFFRQINQSFPFDGNQVEAYTQGVEWLQALLRALARAKHHVHIESYIIEDDAVGRLVRDALIDCVHRGVEVRLIYDDVGCWHVPHRFFNGMRANGIEVRSFLKVRFPLFTSKVNYRNHRKIVVVDGNVGFVGGMNLAERYMRGVRWGIWRDTQLRIEGRAVHGLQSTFLLDWYFVTQSLITSSIYYPRIDRIGGPVVQIVTGSPVSPWRAVLQGLIMAISNAKHYFYIQTPYFLPTEPLLLALQSAALSGVDVRVMIPYKADSVLTHLGSCSYIEYVLQAGVKVYLYKRGFLHSKLIVSDDQFYTIGSTNMDFRSFEHNFEVNAFVYDAATAPAMRELFLRDQRDAEPLQLKSWQQRKWYRKGAESLVRLLSPLL